MSIRLVARADAEARIEALLRALDDVSPAYAIPAMAAVLGTKLAQLSHPERAIFWLAACQAIMVELHDVPPPPLPSAARSA